MNRNYVVRCAAFSLVFAVAAGCGGGSDAGSGDGSGAAGSQASTASPALLNPDSTTLYAAAPDSFRVLFETSKGNFTVMVRRAWAPRGADRFYYLVRNGYYDQNRFFRVLENFVAQFGMNGSPEVNFVWRSMQIEDDPVTQSNIRGRLTFAAAPSPDTRTTQVFINLKDNASLDDMGFAPFGEVIEGMDVVESFFKGYGDGPPSGPGPAQERIVAEGNSYLTSSFPNLDYIIRATIAQ